MTRLVLRMALMGAVAGASAPGGARAEPAPATDKRQVAKRYVDAGKAAQDAGDYDTAIELYDKAYKLVAHPVLIFDIAQAMRLAGRLDEALREYKRYVATGATGPDAQLARDFIAELEARLANRPPAARDATAAAAPRTDGSSPTPDARSGDAPRPDGSSPAPDARSDPSHAPAPEAAPADRPPPQPPSNRLALGLGGGALVLFGAALGFDYWARATHRDAGNQPTNVARLDRQSTANTEYYLAQGFAGAGIVCAGAALWLYFGRHDSAVATAAIRHELVVSPTGIAVIGSF